MGEGRKHDAGKLQWALLPLIGVREIIRVLTEGAEKYEPDNWQRVPDARRRYYEAIMRHVTAWWEGEKNDSEWDFHHLAHAGCCILFLLWFELTGTEYPPAETQ